MTNETQAQNEIVLKKRRKPKKNGRPSTPMYTPELVDQICKAIATSTDGIKTICKKYSGFPSHTIINEWRWLYPEFAEQYNNAKRAQAEQLAESLKERVEQVEIKNTYTDSEGNVRIDAAAVALAKLDCDNIKWTASRLAPKLYGDKVETKHSFSHEEILKKFIEDEISNV